MQIIEKIVSDFEKYGEDKIVFSLWEEADDGTTCIDYRYDVSNFQLEDGQYIKRSTLKELIIRIMQTF